MADKIINRRPFSVNTDIGMDYKFFNHVNWKGICTDKNYFNLDQETFEDCKNVYIDSEGLLKSRPAFKGVEYDFDDTLTECKTFPNNLIVYVGSYTGGHVIRVYKDDEVKASVGVGEKYHLLYDHKLFLFTDIKGKEILYYDDEQEKFITLASEDEDMEEHIYVPIKTLISNGVRTENEALNTLTDYYRERYIYNNIERIANPPYVNRYVDVIADGKTRRVYFEPGAENTIFLPKFSINERNWYNGELLLEMSENDNVILLSSVETSKDDNNSDVNIWNIAYSVDGRVFNEIPSPTFTTYGKPILSKDGSFVVMFGKNGPYAYSLLADDNGVKTFHWTNLLSHNGVVDTLPDIGDIVASDDLPNDNTFRCIGGTFIAPDTFAYSYGTDPYGESSFHMMFYPNIQHVIVEQGKYRKFNFGFTAKDSTYDEHKWYNAAQNEEIKTVFNYDVVNKKYYGAAFYTIYGPGDEVQAHYNERILQYAWYDSDYLEITNQDDESSRTVRYGTLIDRFVTPNREYGCKKILDVKIYPGYQIKLLINAVDDVETDVVIYNYFIERHSATSTRNWLQNSFVRFDDEDNAVFTCEDDVLGNNKYYAAKSDGKFRPFLVVQGGTPFASKFSYKIRHDNVVYSNRIGDDIVYVDVLFDEGNARLNTFVPSHSIKSNVWYLSVENDLYTSSYREENDKFKLYVPRSTKQPFDCPITNLHPVSESQVAIFFDNEIWYTVTSEYGQEYYKSKLNVGLRKGSNVINSIDGKNIIFSSTEGLVYLSYEQLVQSTEQTLTYLSDVIYELYKEYNKDFVKLYLHKYWLYCYNTKSLEFFIFDIRNNSWWKWEYRYPIMNIIVIDNDLRFINDSGGDSNVIVNLSNDTNEYYDYGNWDGEKRTIDWYVTSQKLHLGSLNYYKNVISIIVNNVETEDLGEAVSYNLQIKNYRVNISNRYDDVKTMNYKVNMLRTYVKHSSSRKVNEFQYILSNDSENAIQLPLSIHSVVIKYTVGGQVR
jgi:hypothetical protein